MEHCRSYVEIEFDRNRIISFSRFILFEFDLLFGLLFFFFFVLFCIVNCVIKRTSDLNFNLELLVKGVMK